MAEGAPLLREYTLIAYRGFESLLLRQVFARAVKLVNTADLKSAAREALTVQVRLRAP